MPLSLGGRSFRLTLLPLLAALAALVVGLAPGVLTTGRVDPLDWLVPGGAALLVLALPGPPLPLWRLGWCWALVALPMMLLCGVASARVPWAGLAGLGLGLAGALGLAALAGRRNSSVRWAALVGVLLALRFLADRPQAVPAPARRPVVAVISALPLYGAADEVVRGAAALRTVGLRSPLWQALEPAFDLRPLDGIDARALRDADRLLLAHPRALRPAELVAIDGWVRMGGHAVILADPLLRWPDGRPLGDPRRAPLTSLLDPLLGHWGLELAPARLARDRAAVERRMLSDGALMQVASASRFLAKAGGACTLAEQGLFARCRIGRGEALLVADADWVNDDLWTLAPERPRDAGAWTSDAIPILTHLLGGPALRFTPWQSWLVDGDRLVSGLRQALLTLLGIALLPMLVGRFPIFSHSPKSNAHDQKENMSSFGADSG